MSPGGITWATREVPQHGAYWRERLIRPGVVPALALDSEEGAEGGGGTLIVCVAAVQPEGIQALVVPMPGEATYLFRPPMFERAWWRFAAQHYTWILGCGADRRHVGALTGVEPERIKGRLLDPRRSTQLSGLTLPEVLRAL